MRILREREANATRFDAERKGKWVTVTGRVDGIDSGTVRLGGDGFLSGVWLKGLPDEAQIPLNPGDQFTATCKVGNYVLGTIVMDDCRAGG